MAERRPSNDAPPAKKAKREKVGVGVGVVVTKGRPRVANGTVSDFRILVGLRKGSHGAGQWALPGGWLEKGEEFLDCALRELREETGIAPSGFGPADARRVEGPRRGHAALRGEYPDGRRPLRDGLLLREAQGREDGGARRSRTGCEEWRWCSRGASPSCRSSLRCGRSRRTRGATRSTSSTLG